MCQALRGFIAQRSESQANGVARRVSLCVLWIGQAPTCNVLEDVFFKVAS
jgi:hypothetical protein